MPSATYAATYYVSSAGNDAYSGSASSPWGTIQKCANTINGGDTCIVRDGTYTENVSITRAASSGSLMYFKAENTHGAVVSGRFTISNAAHYVKLEGFKVIIPDGGRSGIGSSGNYNQILNNFITTNSNSLGLNNAAFGLDGHYSLAEGNYVENTCFGYFLYGSNNTFQNNEATLLKLNGSCGDVDYMRFFGSNHLIKNNNFHGINMNEIGKAHVDCFQTFDNGGVEYSISNIIIDGNYCTDAHQGVWMEANIHKQSSEIIIRNNIFSGVGMCSGVSQVQNVHFFNNTCDTNGNGFLCRTSSITSCEFKNNIIYSANGLYAVAEGARAIDGTAEAPGKNNLLYRLAGPATGYANDIKNIDPLFVNRAAGNYRLQQGSPAINAGTTITNWTFPKDKDGVSRPQGSYWDIGAYEYRVTNLGSPQNFRKIVQ